jgi:transcriptional regulator with XRE-family HTH domain
VDRADINELLAERRRLKALPQPSVRRALRVGVGVSQAAVGRQVGVSRAAIGMYEQGSRQPTGEHLQRYLEVLRAFRDEIAMPTEEVAECPAV